jgi:hypothetical protein
MAYPGNTLTCAGGTGGGGGGGGGSKCVHECTVSFTAVKVNVSVKATSCDVRLHSSWVQARYVEASLEREPVVSRPPPSRDSLVLKVA